jgi:dTDP-4-dehydrorhamnose 3,5-epimerase
MAMVTIHESSLIRGVKHVALKTFTDDRGRFLEVFRREWFPERKWDAVQCNRSESRQNVLRGLHYHFRQIDYWYPFSGRIRIALADLRPGSPTRGAVEVREMSGDEPAGVFIPVGVAHGFVALTDAVLTYVVDGYYDVNDEHGVAWDDPDLAVPWGVTAPLLSPRDRNNPRLRDLSAERLPRFEG